MFAGHIDGMMPDGTICEVKTTNDLSKWENGVPKHYWLQASLYSHFLADDADITFAVGTVDQDTYSDPYSWEPEGNVYQFTVPVYPGLDRILEYARFWYAENVAKGRTPKPDAGDMRDCVVVNTLKAMTMTDEQLTMLVDMIGAMQREIDEYESAIDGVKKELEQKKEILRTQMVMRNMTTLDGGNTTATVSTQTREVFDLAKARADGLAGIDPYIQTKTTNVLRFKKSTKVKE